MSVAEVEPTPNKNEMEIRCFCRRAPLLAVCGRDDKGKPFIHVKSARKDRINAEVIVTSGTAHIHCRDCLRWHKVTIKLVTVDQKPEQLPSSLRIE